MSHSATVSGQGSDVVVAADDRLHPTGVSSARTDDEGRIAVDLECIGCQYNLRMCDAEGRCPECGLAVGRSAVGRYLRYHEPKWVQCLAWGMNRFAVALGALVVWAFLLLTLSDEAAYGANAAPGYWVILLVAFIFLGAAVGFALLGTIRATWPDPSPVTREPLLSARRLMRISFALGCVLPFVAGAVAALEALLFPYGGPGWGTSTATILVALAWLGVLSFLLLHARKLAMMIPRPWLGRWTLAVMAAITASGLVVLALSGNWFGWYDLAVPLYDAVWPSTALQNPSSYSFYPGGWSPGDPWYFHEGFSALLRLLQSVAWVGLGFSVLGIVPLFFVYWKALHKEAAQAKATWASSPFASQAGDDG
ncbi:MAG: hypothetical protein AAGH99_10140 [Planctomycetota bacterium]